MPQAEPRTLSEWCKSIINGPAGFRAFVRREWVVLHVTKEHAGARWAIDCLATVDCPGSRKVLVNVIAARAEEGCELCRRLMPAVEEWDAEEEDDA